MARNFTHKTVHKQMYPSTHNFKDDTVGSAPSGWTTSNDADCTTTIIASKSSHRKVLKCVDGNAAGTYEIYITFTSQTSGTIELWFETSDNTLDNLLRLYDATPTLAIEIDLNGIAGVGDDTMYHYRLDFDTAADTYDHYLNGTLIAAGVGFTNNSNALVKILFTSAAADQVTNYIDAIGFSWDTSYHIGDNVHWRHYADQDSDFESEDWGTTSTSIAFVDTDSSGANGTIVINPFFSEHKKVLCLTADAGGDNAQILSNITAASSGTIEFFIRTNEATNVNNFRFYDSGLTIGIQLCIDDDKFQHYTGGAWNDVGLAASDDTWYHIRIDFECGAGGYRGLAADTYYIIIDNIQYGPFNFRNGLDNIERFFLSVTDNADYSMYIDAVSYSWTSGNEVGDNRTFDYNNSYTRDDDTASIINVLMKNQLHGFRSGEFFSATEYDKDEVFVQIYDITSALAFEAEIKRTYFNGTYYIHYLRDRNEEALKNLSSNTFSTKKIHDATDSTCMLKTVLPNVAHESGRLLLVNADSEASTYSPVTKNYPDYLFLRDLSDLGNTVTIVEPSGKIDLDDDKASGDSLDVDTDYDYFVSRPQINNITSGVNYYEIYGAIDPDTGVRFYKVIDNSTSIDDRHKWRYVNNNFQTQTDVDNFATAVSTKVIDVKNIIIEVQGLAAHNMGETLIFKYVKGEYNVAQAAFYIIAEEYNFDLGKSIITLSQGLLEGSKYSAAYESYVHETDQYASEIYETDINTVSLALYPRNGAAFSDQGGVRMDNAAELAETTFLVTPYVDPSRDIILYFTWYITTESADSAVNVTYELTYVVPDCSTAGGTNFSTTTKDLDCSTVGKFTTETITIDSANVINGNLYYIDAVLNDNDADVTLYNITAIYYVKRSL